MSAVLTICNVRGVGTYGTWGSSIYLRCDAHCAFIVLGTSGLGLALATVVTPFLSQGSSSEVQVSITEAVLDVFRY
jgi:hypothetical protein